MMAVVEAAVSVGRRRSARTVCAQVPATPIALTSLVAMMAARVLVVNVLTMKSALKEAAKW